MISLRGEVKVSPSLRFGCCRVSRGRLGLNAVEYSGVRVRGEVSAAVDRVGFGYWGGGRFVCPAPGREKLKA